MLVARLGRGDAAGRDSPLRGPAGSGLESFGRAHFEDISRVEEPAWAEELKSHDELFGRLGSRMPAVLEKRRGTMHQKLAA